MAEKDMIAGPDAMVMGALVMAMTVVVPMAMVVRMAVPV